ncbi:MAG: methyltransferase domain-containing protein [Metallosphaera sp.]
MFDDPEGYLKWYKTHELTYENERRAIESLNPRDCLDIGSGPSVFHESIKGNVISLDLSEFMLRSVEGDRVLADAHFLPFRERAFPCTFSSVTICFLDNLEDFIKEVKRVTRGYFIGCIVRADSSWGEFYSNLGKRGHKYYSKANFISKADFLTLVRKHFVIDKIASVLRYGPTDQEVREEPIGEDGAYVCVRGVRPPDGPGLSNHST